MADALQIRTALDKDFRPLRGDFLQTLMVELTPARGMSTLPLNLGILLDNSGSMDENGKLENAKQACSLLLQQLTPQDRAAVCVFSSGARTIVPSQMFDDGVKRLAQREVAQIQIEGATELLAGLNQVYAEVAPHRSPMSQHL
jgi:secreted protein with Ig-like and vWFA domain